MSNQYDWAEALRKAQQGDRRKQPSLTFSSQSKMTTTPEQLEEQMDYFKKKLHEAAQAKNTAEIQNLVDRLIKCHARLTALLIKNEKDLGESDTSPTVRAHLQKYFSDAAQLLQTFPK